MLSACPKVQKRCGNGWFLGVIIVSSLEERTALDLVAILAAGKPLCVLAVLGRHEGLGNAEKNGGKY
jgi:hypothetical protein